jgi:pyruvate,water dikinase
MALYRPLNEIAIGDITEFGGKAARLGQALRLGCPVLGGVALSAELYRRFMRQGGLQGEVRSILTTMQPQSIGQFQATEWAIRAAFDVRRIPDDVVAVIHEAWAELGVERAAVRSSATSEDSPHQSFVGQHVALLDVASADAAVEAVLACWASLYSAQALSYAHSFGVDLLSSAMGVLIQPMVQADARGALFTVDPVTGNADVFLLSVQEGSRPGVHIFDPYYPLPDEQPTWGQLREMGLLLDEQGVAYQSLDWVLVDGQINVLRARPVTGVPTYLPREAQEEVGCDAPLEWLHEPDVSPRAARPLSWYHQSRSLALHDAYHARPLWPATGQAKPAICYPCGYLYVSAASDTLPETPIEPLRRWFQDLRLLARARKLDQGYTALRERELARLHGLDAQPFSELGPADLAGVLAEIMALHNAFWEESGLVARVDRVLTRLLTRVHRRWLGSDGQDLDLLLWTGEDAWAQAAEQLSELAAATYPDEQAHQDAQRAFFASHRHHFVPGEILAPWRDLAAIAPSRALLEEAWSARQAGEASEPPERQERLAARDQALAEILARLGRLRGKGYMWLLGLGRRYRTLARDSHAPVALCRVLESDIVGEVGRRLRQAALVDACQEASLFTCRELLDWLQGRMANDAAARLAAERRAALRRWARYAPPERIEPPTDAALEVEGAPNQKLTGRAICAGKVVGKARVIRSSGEASQALPGEVLVCHELPFELTPLFSVVSGVVAEGGDLLDHVSVLAREYGVPTVFGVEDATRRIQTGDTLDVDATHGIVVRRLPEPDWEQWAI